MVITLFQRNKQEQGRVMTPFTFEMLLANQITIREPDSKMVFCVDLNKKEVNK